MVQIGDMTIQNEAVVLPVSAVGTFTRDSTIASGIQPVTGLTFRPSAIHMWGNIVVSASGISVGFSDGVTDNCTTWNGLTGFGYTAFTNLIVRIGNANAWHLDGTVQSFDEFGFTMDWTKVGSTSGIATMGFLAIK